MFKLVQIPEITVVVEFTVPGQKDTASIDATWRLLRRKEFEAFQQRVDQEQLSDEQVLDEMLVKLTGVADEQGDPAADTPELRRAILQEDYVARPLMLSFWTAQQGREKHVAKN
ncbi:hypothetical protein GY26_16020 [Gammaproteobacteria bacterium MFB021]|nr:hypothetical protein GY26_16020 [Gammaproteobacteria bacterium MFB021]